MSGKRFVDLGLEIRFEADRPVVVVRGDVDLVSAPLITAILGGVAAQGHTAIVLDVRDLRFMGAAGIGLIVETARHLDSIGGRLTVRSPPAFVLRLLLTTGVHGLVSMEPNDPNVVHLGPEQTDGEPVTVPLGSTAELVSHLEDLGMPMHASGVVDRALRLITVLAHATIDRADGVSVSLQREGTISTVAWTDDTVLHMDLHQYETREGPCLDASRTGRWFHIEALEEEDRWPEFVPRALDEGIASILSTPLTTASTPVGALNIYSKSAGAFGPAQLDLLALFAEQASDLVTSSVTEHDDATRLAHALVDRELIAQAQGVLMARDGLTAQEAAAVLFRTARAAQSTVSEQAFAVVSSTRTDSAPPP